MLALKIYMVFYKASLRVTLFTHWLYCPKKLLSLDNTANIIVLVGDAQENKRIEDYKERQKHTDTRDRLNSSKRGAIEQDMV